MGGIKEKLILFQLLGFFLITLGSEWLNTKVEWKEYLSHFGSSLYQECTNICWQPGKMGVAEKNLFYENKKKKLLY